MSQTASQQEFNNLKQQYDQLLDKNQNDLIKINLKQKNLNEQLQKMQSQCKLKEEALNRRVTELEEEIVKLKSESTQNSQAKKSEQKIQQLQIDLRRLTDQNIILTAEINSLNIQFQEQREKNQKIINQTERMKKYIESCENQLRQFRQEETKKVANASAMTVEPLISQQEISYLREKLNKRESQLESLKQKHSEINEQLKAAQEQAKTFLQSEKRYMKLLKKRESELSVMEGEIGKLRISTKPRKKTESVEGQCPKCSNYKQQIQLLKQMVKSTQGMVRVKEIENSKYKIHISSESPINHSKSASKHIDKGTPLPPLRKK